MSEQRTTFSIDLEGNVQEQANQFARSVDDLNQSITEDLDELKAMNAALRNLKSGGQANTQTFKDLKDQIEAKRQKVGTSTKTLLEQGGAFKKVGETAKVETKKATDGMLKLVDTLKTAPGPIGSMTNSATSLGSALGSAGAAGAAGLAVAAFVALAAAVVVATVKLAGFALTAADARRAELTQLQGLEKMRTWFGLAGDKANYMQATLDKVSMKVSTGRGKLIEYTRQLEMMGLRGKNLSKSLEAMAIVESVQGESRAQLFASQAAGAAMLGGSVDKLADRIKDRLGGIAAKRMLELSVITEKWHENLGKLFGDVKVEGFLGGLKTITDLFSQGTASGQAMKAMIEAWLNPLFGGMSKGTPIIKRFFQGMILGALDLTIWFLKVRIGFQETFGSIKLGKFDALNLALKVGKFALIGMVIGAGLLAAALGGVIAIAFTLETAVFRAIAMVPAAIAGLIVIGPKVKAWLSSTVSSAWNYLKTFDWAALGKSLVDGFVNGIRSSAARAVGSIKDLANWMKKAFTGEWKISSPSKVSAGYAKNIIEGHELETRRLGPRAARAMAEVMSPGAVFGGGGQVGGGFGVVAARSARMANVVIERLIIEAHGPTVADVIAESRAQLELQLEQMLLEMGANA